VRPRWLDARLVVDGPQQAAGQVRPRRRQAAVVAPVVEDEVAAVVVRRSD